ncbi:MAG: hypothetical protein O7B35_13695 [Deltaproteobacteria bacterium]|nr:hypothetical protein [Deltaproteobacteria bacterium]
MENLRSCTEETRDRLRAEIQSEIKGIEAAYLAAKTQEENLRAGMQEQKESVLSLKDSAVQYAILAREVDTNRRLYDGACFSA